MTTFSEYINYNDITLGSYSIQFPIITIEGKERFNEHIQVLTFYHELTHKIIIELSELGFYYRFLLSINNKGYPVFSQSYSDEIRYINESIATNVEVLIAKIIKLNYHNNIASYNTYYKSAFLELKGLHSQIKVSDEELLYLILNIGIHTFSMPLFDLFKSSNKINNREFQKLLKEGNLNVKKRFENSVQSLIKALKECSNFDEALNLHNNNFKFAFRIITKDSLEKQTTEINKAFLNLIEQIESLKNGYAQSDNKSIKELFGLVRLNALNEVGIHFHLRFFVDSITVLKNTKQLKDIAESTVKQDKLTYINFMVNTYEFEIKNLFPIPAFHTLVVIDRSDNNFLKFDNAFLDEVYIATIENSSINNILSNFINQELHQLVFAYYNFNFEKNELFQLELNRNSHIILTNNIFSMKDLDIILPLLELSGHKYKVIFVFQESTHFLCLKRVEYQGWFLIAPVFDELIQGLVDLFGKLDYVQYCEDKEDYMEDNYSEAYMVSFIAHFTNCGW